MSCGNGAEALLLEEDEEDAAGAEKRGKSAENNELRPEENTRHEKTKQTRPT